MPGRSIVKKYFSELCGFSDENEVDDGYDEGMTSSSAADSQGDLVPSPESPPTNNKYGLQSTVLSGLTFPSLHRVTYSLVPNVTQKSIETHACVPFAKVLGWIIHTFELIEICCAERKTWQTTIPLKHTDSKLVHVRNVISNKTTQQICIFWFAWSELSTHLFSALVAEVVKPTLLYKSCSNQKINSTLLFQF